MHWLWRQQDLDLCWMGFLGLPWKSQKPSFSFAIWYPSQSLWLVWSFEILGLVKTLLGRRCFFDLWSRPEEESSREQEEKLDICELIGDVEIVVFKSCRRLGVEIRSHTTRHSHWRSFFPHSDGHRNLVSATYIYRICVVYRLNKSLRGV